LSKLSRKSDAATAVRYPLGRWNVLLRHLDHSRIEVDDATERALRPVAMSRKSYLFAGPDTRSERAAIYSLIATAKLDGLALEAYLRNALSRVADHPVIDFDELLPRNLGTNPGEQSLHAV
jgi:transposase